MQKKRAFGHKITNTTNKCVRLKMMKKSQVITFCRLLISLNAQAKDLTLDQKESTFKWTGKATLNTFRLNGSLKKTNLEKSLLKPIIAR